MFLVENFGHRLRSAFPTESLERPFKPYCLSRVATWLYIVFHFLNLPDANLTLPTRQPYDTR